jgi:tRNA dimethylallyltransferase
MLLRFPIIVGPTAGGKSSLGVALAHALRKTGDLASEIVTADSMQVYRGMDIGTAKPTVEEREGVRHHLIDIAEPTDPFSVDRWLALAEPLIATLRERDIVPIVVGGTHLYAKALLEGLFQSPEPDPELRRELQDMEPARRRALLEEVDPAAAARIHPNDARRTVRALEVWKSTGVPISDHQGQWDSGRVRSDALLVGIDWPAEAVNRRINARTRDMMDRGFLEEVRILWSAGRLGPQASQALGYKQLLAVLEGRMTLDAGVERIKIETRRFAKNQRTWLRRLRTTPGSHWIDAQSTPPDQWAQPIVTKLLMESDPPHGAAGAPGSRGNHPNR